MVKLDVDIEINEKFQLIKQNDLRKMVESVCKTIFDDDQIFLYRYKFLQRYSKNLCVAIVDDECICELNKKFRKHDKPTNVLSFSNIDDKTHMLSQDSVITIGDVVISYETITKEAIEQNKNFIHHLLHMLVHGILHLLGYDHNNEKDAEEMEAKEIEILEKFGIKSPY